MARYIELDEVRAKIEKIIADETESIKSFEHSKNVSEVQRSNARIGVLMHIRSLLNTLEVKEVQDEPVSNPTPNEKMSVERWKEACKAACCDRNYRSHYGLTETRDDYFVDGVQWADEHPKEEPISEDLEEASKEWLRPQLDKSYANYGEKKMMELTHFDGYAMLDAIEFGAKWKEEQIIKDAIDITIKQGCTDLGILIKGLDEGKFSFGDKVKVIIIKSE